MKMQDLRFVAHIDILGFRDITRKNDDIAWALLSTLRDDVIHRLQDTYSQSILRDSHAVVLDRFKFLLFSDTLLVFSLSNTWDDLIIITFFVGQIFAVCIEKAIPIRGAISYGNFSFNLEKSLFCGKALIDAYDLGESSQWQGIVVTNEVAQMILEDERCNKGLAALLTKWNLEFKGEKDEVISKDCYVIDWINAFKGKFNIPPPISIYDWYKAFEQWFGPFDSLPLSVKRKYINTLEFVNYRLKHR